MPLSLTDTKNLWFLLLK